MPIIPAASLAAVFLDTGVLGFATQKSGKSQEADDCKEWTVNIQQFTGALLIVPEIADYELRREFLLRGNADAIRRLEEFERVTTYAPTNMATWRTAAGLWASMRKAGKPTAGREALDGDALLAATVFTWCQFFEVSSSAVVVATTNVSDLARFVDESGSALQAVTWREIAL